MTEHAEKVARRKAEIVAKRLAEEDGNKIVAVTGSGGFVEYRFKDESVELWTEHWLRGLICVKKRKDKNDPRL